MTLGWLLVWAGLVFLTMVLAEEKMRRDEERVFADATWWAVLRTIRCVHDARGTSLPAEEIVDKNFEDEFFGPSVLTPEEKRYIVAALDEIRRNR